jgi:hypothetical protein
MPLVVVPLSMMMRLWSRMRLLLHGRYPACGQTPRPLPARLPFRWAANSTAVTAQQQAAGFQQGQILADGDFGGGKASRQFIDADFARSCTSVAMAAALLGISFGH